MAYNRSLQRIFEQLESTSKELYVVPIRNAGMSALHHFDLTTDIQSFLAALGLPVRAPAEESVEGLEAINPT